MSRTRSCATSVSPLHVSSMSVRWLAARCFEFPENLRPMRFFLASFLALTPFLASCSGSAGAPPGYIEACYGGNFSRNRTNKAPILVAPLDIPDDQWPRLTAILQNIGNRHGLEIFNDTRREQYLSMLSISLCSSRGVFALVDRRVFRDAKGRVISSSPLTLQLYAYKNETSWNWT
jgi:hypothetical protein